MSKKKSKGERPISSYIDSAKSLARFAPALKKYKRRKTLSRWEKAAITKKENALRFHTTTLIPLNKKMARTFKAQLFVPTVYDKATKRYIEGKSTQGIRAIELRNTSPTASIHKLKDDMIVTSNGKTWLYWRLNRSDVKTKRGMKEAAEKAFSQQL